jgi:hypothetical protein
LIEVTALCSLGKLQPWRAASGQFFCNEFCADDAEEARFQSYHKAGRRPQAHAPRPHASKRSQIIIAGLAVQNLQLPVSAAAEATAEFGIGMTENSLAHERSSRISRPLIIGSGIAVAFAAFMVGWFVVTVLSGDSVAMVTTLADDIPVMTTTINVPDPSSSTALAPLAAPAGSDRVLASDIDTGEPTFVPLPTPRPRRLIPRPQPPLNIHGIY